MDRARAIVRGLTSVLLFACFGLGALLIAPVVLALRRPDRGQPVVRAAWRLAALAFVKTGLISIDARGLRSCRGCVIAANHPSLIDVVLIVSRLPRTLYVAKHALKGNPFLSAIVRATALPDDATLPDVAAPYLAAGWNVLIFPEGTRSPRNGGLNRFHRGAAQLALRANAPLVPVGVRMDRRLLAKGQPAWDMGARRVGVCLTCGAPIRSAVGGTSRHAEAVALTARLHEALSDMVE